MSATVTRWGGGATPRTNTKRAVALASGAALGAFALGPVLFTPNAANPIPTSGQLPWFVLLAAIEATVFGAGVAFAVFGRPHVRRHFAINARATAVHVSVTWALASWWLHDNLHMVNGMNLGGLLLIEYVFHVTLIVGAAVVAWAFVAEARDHSQP
jgi:hypothetical protein